jgi:hypothetical protein
MGLLPSSGYGGQQLAGVVVRRVGEDRAVLVPQVRAAAVPDREEQPAVLGLDGERAGVRRTAGHHVAVEVTGDVDGLAAVERDPQELGVARATTALRPATEIADTTRPAEARTRQSSSQWC